MQQPQPCCVAWCLKCAYQLMDMVLSLAQERGALSQILGFGLLVSEMFGKQNATSQGTAQQTNIPVFFGLSISFASKELKKNLWVFRIFRTTLCPQWHWKSSCPSFHFTGVTDGNSESDGNDDALGGISVHYIVSAELNGVRAVGKSRHLLSCWFFRSLHHCWEDGNYPRCITSDRLILS